MTFFLLSQFVSKPNTLRLFQIWLNLPAKCKMAEPAFVMHWAEQIPKIKEDDGRVEVCKLVMLTPST